MTATPAPASVERLRGCPLCAATAWSPLPVPRRWIGLAVFRDLEGILGLVRCRGCGLVFTQPRPSEDRLSAFYAGDTYTCHEAAGTASAGAKADYVFARLEPLIAPDVPRSLLDYGAGGGSFLRHARDRGWEVHGFEPGRRGLESCRRSGLDVTDRLEDLDSRTFGLVTLHHVLEHLPAPIEALERLHGFIGQGGRLYVEVPNARSLRARLAFPAFSRRFRVDERYRAFPIHLIYYADRTLRGMLARAGWTVERTFTVGLGLDEYFTRSDSPSSAPPVPAGPQRPAGNSKRRLLHRVRDAFLGTGLGENLAAVAYPANGGNHL